MDSVLVDAFAGTIIKFLDGGMSKAVFLAAQQECHQQLLTVLSRRVQQKSEYYGHSNHPEIAQLMTAMEQATLEHNTYDLVGELAICELSEQEQQTANKENPFQQNITSLSSSSIADQEKARFSHYDIVTSTIDKNPTLRRSLAVLTWLERCANRATTAGHKKIYNEEVKYARTAAKSAPSTERLDPDAITRGLNDPTVSSSVKADLEQREAVLQGFLYHLWRLVRAGDVNAAVQLCRDSDQSWRAGILAGAAFWSESLARATRDEDVMDDDDQEEAKADLARGIVGPSNQDINGFVAGNRRHFLWKKLCRQYCADATQARIPIEAAIYGAICGHAETVYPHCQTWEDFVWIYIKTNVDCTLDRALADELTSRQWDYQQDAQFHALTQVPDFNEDSIRSFFDYSPSPDTSSLVTLLDTHRPQLKSRLDNPFHVLQKLVILREYNLIEFHIAGQVASYITRTHGMQAYSDFLEYCRRLMPFTEDELCVIELPDAQTLSQSHMTLGEDFLIFSLHTYLSFYLPQSGTQLSSFHLTALGNYLLLAFTRFFLIERGRMHYVAPYCVLFGPLEPFQRLLQPDVLSLVYVDFLSSFDDVKQISELLSIAQVYLDVDSMSAIRCQLVSACIQRARNDFTTQQAALAFLDLEDDLFNRLTEDGKREYMTQVLIQVNHLYRLLIDEGREQMEEYLRLVHRETLKTTAMWSWVNGTFLNDSKSHNNKKNMADASADVVKAAEELFNHDDTEELHTAFDDAKALLDDLEFRNALHEFRHWSALAASLAGRKAWALHHHTRPVANVDNLNAWEDEDERNFLEHLFKPAMTLLNDTSFLVLPYTDTRHTEALIQLKSKSVMLLCFLLVSVCVEMEYQTGLQQVKALASTTLQDQFLPQDREALLNEIERNMLQ